MTRLPTFWREVDDLFRDLGAPVAREAAPTRAVTPPADITETAKSVVIQVDLPGVNPELIDVKLDHDVLTISAERTREKAVEGDEAVRQERAWGKFSRSFTLPNTLDGTQPEATYKHGVLTLTLPKRAEAQPRSLKVKVEA
jgi:HSP20 family protein